MPLVPGGPIKPPGGQSPTAGLRVHTFDKSGRKISTVDQRDFATEKTERIREIKEATFESLELSDWRVTREAERLVGGASPSPIGAALVAAREQARALCNSFEASLFMTRNLKELDAAWDAGHAAFYAKLQDAENQANNLGGGKPKGSR